MRLLPTRTIVLALLLAIPAPSSAADGSERVVVVGNAASWALSGLDARWREGALRLRSLRRYRRGGRVRWRALAREKGARAIIEAHRRGRGRRCRVSLVLRDATGKRTASAPLRRATRVRVARWVARQTAALLPYLAQKATSGGTTLRAPAWALKSEPASAPSSAPARPIAGSVPASAPAKGAGVEIDAIAAEHLAREPLFVEPNAVATAAAAPVVSAPTLARANSNTPRLPFKLSGAIWAEHLSYLLDRDGETINSRNEVALDLVLSTRIGSATKFAHAVINGLARADLSDDERTEAFFKEAYVRAGWGALTILAGKRLLGWGVTDAFNPTNTLRRTDFRDPLQPQDRGLFVLQSKLLLGKNVFVEGVWAPLFEDPLQPAPTGIDPGTGLLVSSSRWFVGPTEALVVIPAAGLADGPQSFQYAGRLGLSIEAFDLSLSYSYSYLPLPEFALIGPGLLRGAYHRRHLVGADFQTTFGRVALKVEAAASFTDDLDGTKDDVPDSFVNYVAQLEISSLRLGRSGHELRLQAQLYGDHGLGGEKLDQSLLHPFRFLAIGFLEWKYLEHTALAVTALYDFPNGLGVRAELWHELVDGLRLELEGLYLDGNSESFFGIFRRNHRVLGRLKYAF